MLPSPGFTSAMPPAAEIAAILLPAREVGGDLYDYFPVRERQILFSVGDVSNKGIPRGAVHGPIVGPVPHSVGIGVETPDRLLTGINTRLAESDDACMFVTAGCGLLDLDSGLLRYASAGHEPPLLKRVEGDVVVLAAESANGAAMGIEPDSKYQLQERYLAPGDTVILYTDGVTEAEGVDGSLFGIERFVELLRTAPDGTPAVLVRRIVESVTTHAAGFHATDDLTALAMRFSPAGITAAAQQGGAHWTWAVDDSSQEVARTLGWIETILRAREEKQDRIADVVLIAEELLTNILRAAASSPGIRILVELVWSIGNVVLTVRDTGDPFNPLSIDSSQLDADIATRPVGGLGIVLVKKLASACHYSRDANWNVLQVSIGPDPPT